MKLNFLKFFLIVFVLTFAVLNGRFLYSNVRFALFGPGTNKIIIPAQNIGIQDQDQARLIIEKIGINVPIVFGTGTDQKSIYDSLANGVVNYPGSAKPGDGGVSIILGHSSAYPWYKGSYGSVFALLGKLKTGDKFYVKYSSGQMFTYSVKKSFIFSPFTNDARLSEIEKNSKNSIVLVSCWPIGTNFRRIAIQGELI